MARVPRAISSVYVPSVINRFLFGQWVVIYFIMQLLLKKITKEHNLIYSQARSFAVRYFVYFYNRYGNHSADEIFDSSALTVPFVVNSFAFNQNRNAVFIRSTAFYFILTVAIYIARFYVPCRFRGYFGGLRYNMQYISSIYFCISLLCIL